MPVSVWGGTSTSQPSKLPVRRESRIETDTGGPGAERGDGEGGTCCVHGQVGCDFVQVLSESQALARGQSNEKEIGESWDPSLGSLTDRDDDTFSRTVDLSSAVMR